ncbi:hypothetical protein [Natronospira sp.]|uniref:hypothetical protein n=1 Tax=Natronospira sp. TaxID=2024970 RepID=UPI003873572D
MQQKLIKLINYQQLPDNESIEFLEKMVENYPYCQPFRMLLTKALMPGKSSVFEYHHNISSAIAPDRRVFQNYLDDKHSLLHEKSKTTPQIGFEAQDNQIVSSKLYEDEAEIISERKRRQQAIIDKFLEQNPRIEARGKEIPEGDIAAESIAYKADVASETLAEILLQQGKNQEAEMIYHKLSLMFPEKSSYFAKKLKIIRNQNN